MDDTIFDKIEEVDLQKTMEKSYKIGRAHV